MNTDEADRSVFRGQGPKSSSKKSDTQSCGLSLPNSSSSGKSLQLSTKLSLPSPDKSMVGSESLRLSFGPTSEFARSLTGKDILDLPSPDRASSKNLDLSPAASEIKETRQVFLPQAPQKSGTFPFRIRGKQTFDKKQIQQIKRVLNLQHSRPNRTGNVPQQGFGGLQVFPGLNHLKTPWWQCPLCEFQIFKNETDRENDPYHARRRRLKNVHGQV